ncbi:hypothetical protein MVEN_00309900 [Mycena venus]|uniref:C2H2-type domain-containing protein n=1 Tax=Mycena venus TaxID=2733690 RepID=A0A8H7DF09_9AGAR|nr:hypothetical protein MVEN_00309900 [Mycena venus]
MSSAPENNSARIKCPTCSRTFTARSLLCHYRQTTNERCLDYYHSILESNAFEAEAEDLVPGQHPLSPMAEDLEPSGYPIDEEETDSSIPSLVPDEDSDEEEEEPPQWEPPATQQPGASNSNPTGDNASADVVTASQPAPEDHLVRKPHVTRFRGRAGSPLAQTELPAFQKYKSQLSEMDDNLWAPFQTQMDWEIARWAKLRGSTSTAFTDLLVIDGVVEALGLSYKNSRELNEIIDQSIPKGRPVFKRHEIVVGGEAFDVYFRPILDCIRALYSDPEFAQDLIFAPEWHYTDEDKTVRLFHDLHTGKWWWETQKTLEKRCPGATIVLVIISTDKTQIMMFRNKAAYPVYMTIGNILKDIRHKPSRGAYILIGYLPTTCLDHIKVAAARRCVLTNLYHACMRKILGLLKNAELDGMEMASGDGVVRHCHPIFAIFAGYYPEQVFATGVMTRECPTCPTPCNELEDLAELYELCNLDTVLEALALADGNATEFTRACLAAGIKLIYHPFWEDLPFVNIYLSITPDILRQLYQGVIKHVVAWITEAYGPIEIDARCRRLPPNHNARLFLKGITTLSRVSGTEHSHICRILLGLIIDLCLPSGHSPMRLIRSVRAALDFLYHSQYPIHSTETISQLNDNLKTFHNNKSIFVDLGIRNHFNFPKLHNISHWPLFIQLFGTLDNHNTEYTERLHINLAKDAYRATNRKDECLQMTLWLERKEKTLCHDKFICWCLSGSPSSETKNPEWRIPNFLQHWHLQMTKFPSTYGIQLSQLETAYGAEYFHDAFAQFAVAFKHPTFSNRQVELAATDFNLPFQSVSVFHKIKFWNEDPLGCENAGDALDVVHVKPGYTNKHGCLIGGRFDTVLVNDGTGAHTGVKGYCVSQVRVVFSLRNSIQDLLFPEAKPSEHLAYVEWFSKFPKSPDSNHKMYKISHPAQRTASVIPISNIQRSIHLFPQFGPIAP